MAQLQHLSKLPRHPVTKMTSPNDEMDLSPSHTRVGTPIDLPTSTGNFLSANGMDHGNDKTIYKYQRLIQTHSKLPGKRWKFQR
ncbi:hypothetical protein TNIN_491631 [Trichonephila inaurata madagascariensis]|uniref:Uncharacterized protein n=1 Tax=Trichonephila inaurata madagascariensis TaxID=2747483 RepID=A0A8X6YGB7_9ARAC|nr:hypothetical protein TNIN_493711 [Trichonephila inaurata madagascariensis]GFY72430.1 hypothetical protein TNIN_491631 [Trichonephila inaurata madagascariensis]